jgi:hypothetical protein
MGLRILKMNFTEYEENRKFWRNELYLELEAYMKEMREITQTKRDGVYKTTPQIFPDMNLDKGSEAMTIMRWLKQFIETPTNKLECI